MFRPHLLYKFQKHNRKRLENVTENSNYENDASDDQKTILKYKKNVAIQIFLIICV